MKKTMPPTNDNKIAVMAGEWQNWSNWSHCTSSCGEGLRMRARGCSEPPFEGIDRCPGNATEVEDCKTSDCTGDIFLCYGTKRVLSLWNPF